MGGYHAHIRQSLYGRWQQPTSVFTQQGRAVTTLALRIDKTGSIIRAWIVRSSGNPVMDQSVLDAARAVGRFQALPVGLGQESYEIEIDFELL